MTRVEIHPLSVGSCSHCERVTMAGGSWRSVTFPSFSFLILHPVEGPILYDTGYASHFADATRGFPECAYRWLTPVRQSPEEQLSARLAAHGLRLRDVRWCLISHFHADHIAGLRDLSEARFLCMRDDWQGIRSGTRLSRLRKGLLTSLLPEDFDARTRFAETTPSSALAGAWAAFDAGHDLLGDGSLIAIALPGHAPRQMGLLLRDPQDREVLLCADASWSGRAVRELRMPMRVAGQVMHDWAAYKRTLTGLHQLVAAHPELVVLPSHCAESVARYAQTATRRAWSA